MTNNARDITDWLFRALMFESNASHFQSAAIRVGADSTEAERQLLGEILDPFPISLRNDAMRMTRAYAMLFCFENTVRQLVKERLQERFGVDWWENGVPKKIRDLAESRQKKAKDNTWLEGEKDDAMEFAEFGHLADIVIGKWDDFSDLIPSQHWIKQRMDDLEQARNFIAHNRILRQTEFQRIEIVIQDWNRQVGI